MNFLADLKKVTSDMQTHKNASLRTGPAPFKAPGGGASPVAPKAAAPQVKPPVFMRDGKKWIIVSGMDEEDDEVEVCDV